MKRGRGVVLVFLVLVHNTHRHFHSSDMGKVTRLVHPSIHSHRNLAHSQCLCLFQTQQLEETDEENVFGFGEETDTRTQLATRFVA
jgi:hypothetical protein